LVLWFPGTEKRLDCLLSNCLTMNVTDGYSRNEIKHLHFYQA
jgi:hypothetical protein